MNMHQHRSVGSLARQLLAGAIASTGLSLAGSEPLPGPAPNANGPVVLPQATAPQMLIEAVPRSTVANTVYDAAYDCECPGPQGPPLRHYGKPWIPPRPFGTYVRAGAAAQIENGLAAQLVLYHYDFVAADGRPGVELNLRGQARLEKLLCLGELVPCPLIIELDERNPLLNAARRAHVIGQLQQVAVSFPAERIVLGRPAARGISGDEAIAIQRIVQEQVQSMGALQSYSGGQMSPFNNAPGASGAAGASGGGATQGR
jgi:hypothetical protein